MTTLSTVSLTIHAGQSLSDPVDCSGFDRIARILVPNTWSVAPLTFCLSPDGVNFHNLHHVDSNSLFGYEVQVPRCPANAAITLPSTMGSAVAFVKLRSGTSTLPVPQAQDCQFQLVLETSASSKQAIMEPASG
jgi:hypothetical protein